MWHKPCRTFHPWCPCIKTRCLLRPSDAYRHHYSKPSLVQIMAWRFLGAKPLSDPMLTYCELDPLEYISVKFNHNLNIFIQENAFENVVRKLAAILPRHQYVKMVLVLGHIFSWKRGVTYTSDNLLIFLQMYSTLHWERLYQWLSARLQ